MKFSVLLPTRNRLSLLKLAVETVRRQTYDNWEIIISDNDSTDPIKEWVDGLGDNRIHYFRTEGFVPVTDNWNNAHSRATGDYVLMLGDDDGLLPGYFEKARALIEAYERPQVLYHGALLYAYPKVVTEHPQRYVSRQVYLDDQSGQPYKLPVGRARGIAKNIMNFRMVLALNMQFSLMRRDFADSVSRNGKFYYSPYPDFYATTVYFAMADDILIVPEPMAVIGISPKSFGYFFFNSNQEQGAKFLNNLREDDIPSTVRNIVLPGGYHNTCWLLAMEHAHINFPEVPELRPNYSRYRLVQTGYIYKGHHTGRQVSTSRLREFNSHLTAAERVRFGWPMAAFFGLTNMVPKSSARRLIEWARSMGRQHPPPQEISSLQGCKDIVDLFEAQYSGAAQK